MMQETTDKALLRAGFNLHNAFNTMVTDIKANPDHWLEIIEKKLDTISPLIIQYHKIAAKVRDDTLTQGLPDYLSNANVNTLILMDDFNQEILDFDEFVDNDNHIKAFTKFVRTINSTNEMLLHLKLSTN